MSVFDKLETFEQRVAPAPTCSSCPHLKFSPGTKFCTECGGKLTTPEPAQHQPTQPTLIKCGKCYHTNPIANKFCAECGTNLKNCQTTGREALDLPMSPRRQYVPPDHTSQPIPTVKENPHYDISGLNVRGQ